MLADSAFLQEKDAAFLEKRNFRRRAISLADQNPPVPPLYTRADAERAVGHFDSCRLHEEKTIGAGLSVNLTNAGHILRLGIGAAEDTMKATGRSNCYSPAIWAPRPADSSRSDPAPEADYLILESTYGGRLHQPLESVEEKLMRLINKTAARGGHVIVPAFAVGRTQQLVLLLHQLSEEKRIPNIPIFVDSPLAINVTEVFRNHPDEFDADAEAFVRDGQDPFGFHRLKYLRESAESKTLNDLRTPFVVISASGMCEGGRILHHLRIALKIPEILSSSLDFRP